MGGGAPRSSCLGGESYSSPGRCRSPARSSCLGLTRRTISTTFTLPQNSASGFIDLTLVSWLAAIQFRRWCPIWPRHNGPVLAAANNRADCFRVADENEPAGAGDGSRVPAIKTSHAT